MLQSRVWRVLGKQLFSQLHPMDSQVAIRGRRGLRIIKVIEKMNFDSIICRGKDFGIELVNLRGFLHRGYGKSLIELSLDLYVHERGLATRLVAESQKGQYEAAGLRQ